MSLSWDGLLGVVRGVGLRKCKEGSKRVGKCTGSADLRLGDWAIT